MKHGKAWRRKRLISISIFGANGRMGRAIADAAANRDGISISGGSADVFLDFSAPAAVEEHLKTAVSAGIPILVGTTGLNDLHRRLIDAASAKIAVIEAANTSLGVTLLSHLVEQAAKRLGPAWDIEIVEMHHRFKADAPSGTALMLGRAAAAGRGADLGSVADWRRDGVVGSRREGQIGFASLRGGTVAGDHQVILAGEHERLELGHRAESRTVFALGAIEAALWLAGKPAGRYTMADVLGLA